MCIIVSGCILSGSTERLQAQYGQIRGPTYWVEHLCVMFDNGSEAAVLFNKVVGIEHSFAK